MDLRQQIKILCAFEQITQAELARRFGCSPQTFSNKLRRGSFSIDELKKIGELTHCEYISGFVLPNGDKIL